MNLLFMFTITNLLLTKARTSQRLTMSQVRTAIDEVEDNGAFKRGDSAWRSWVSQEEDAEFPAEKDRYHLFVAMACPWAHRTLILRAMKGLEDAISVTVVMPVWQKTREDPNDKHSGWVFADPGGAPYQNSIGLGGPFPSHQQGCDPEPFFGCKSIRELYDKAKDVDGKYTVPILWDKKRNTIVSNESSEIIRMLNSEFNKFASKPELNLYPEDMIKANKEVNDWIYPTINNGVYRCGFATSQSAYDTAIAELTQSIDRVEQILSTQRYIAGNKLTLADIRLFVTLLRFDEVYAVYFKTNTRSMATCPNILNYLREIYQIPGIKDTVDMDQIKLHYYASHPDRNRWSIVAKGPDFEALLKQEHNRASLL